MTDAIQGELFLSTLPLVIARLTPIVVFTPLFGGEAASRRFRTGVLLALGVVFALPMSGPGAPPLPGGVDYALLAAKEAVIGTILAVFLIFAFQVAASAGALIDVARGATIATVLDPMTRQQTPVVGTAMSVLIVTAFVTLGGYTLVIDALVRSFAFAPVAAPAPITVQSGPLALAAMRTAGAFFELTVRLAAPVLVMILLIDVTLGLLNRLTPQIQVFFLGITIKGWVGLLAVFLSLAAFADEALAWISYVFGLALHTLEAVI